MFCWRCGKQIPDYSLFCSSCGAEVRAGTEDGETAKRTTLARVSNKENCPVEFFIRNYRIAFCEEIQEYTSRYKKYFDEFHSYLTQKTTDLSNEVKGLKDIDKILDTFLEYGVNIGDWLVEMSHQKLLAERVYTISKERLSELYCNSASHFLKAYREFSEKYLLIVADEEKLKQYKEYQRAHRSRWEGGGFGVKGAIRGAITAGAMNIGTDLIRSIGNAWVDSEDNKKILAQKRELIKSKNWILNFMIALQTDGEQMFKIYVEFLAQDGKMALPDHLNEDTAKTFLENARTIKDDAQAQIKLLTDSIQMFPYSVKPYILLFNLLGQADPEVLVPFEYFQPKYSIELYLNKYYRQFIKSVEDYTNLQAEELMTAQEQIQKDLSKIAAQKDSSLFYCQYGKAHGKDLETLLSNIQRYQRTSDDGIEFPTVEALNTYYAEKDLFAPYQAAIRIRQLPFEEQTELLNEAKSKGFTSEYIISALQKREQQLERCSSLHEIYPGSFEDYFKRIWEERDPNEIYQRLPEYVTKEIERLPYAAIMSVVSDCRVTIYPEPLSSSTSDAWLVISDFCVMVVLPNPQTSHVIRTADLDKVSLMEETLRLYRNHSDYEEIYFRIPYEGISKLRNYINMLNEALTITRENMKQRLCPACAAQLFEGARFCGACGYRLAIRSENVQ